MAEHPRPAPYAMESCKKNKMVSFRLSHEEYLLYRDACVLHGARSLSEFARAAMQKLLSSRDTQPVSDDVEQLRLRVQTLSDEVQQLSDLVRLKL